MVRERLGQKFDPITIEAMRQNAAQVELMRLNNYDVGLNNFDYVDAFIASAILRKTGIEHANPIGNLFFKTSDERLKAIELLGEVLPERFGHLWKKADTEQLNKMQPVEAKIWLRNQPIDPGFLIGTSKDPNLDIKSSVS